MKNPKAYQLARRYRESNLTSTPASNSTDILSSTCRHVQSSSETIRNIFRDNQQTRLRKLELSKEKEYNVLGLRQLKIYNRIKDRKKRDLRSNREELTFGTYISVRTSRLPSQPLFLTKDQVLKVQTPKLTGTIKTEYLYPYRACTLQNSTSSSVKTHKTGCEQVCLREKFSFAKLKRRMQEYKNTWEKFCCRKENRYNGTMILKRSKRMVLNESLECWDHHKLTEFDKSWRDPKNEEAVPWNQTLRSNDGDNPTAVRDIELIESNGLMTSGRSKQQKQAQWIEQKHKEGYFFVRTQNNPTKVNRA